MYLYDCPLYTTITHQDTDILLVYCRLSLIAYLKYLVTQDKSIRSFCWAIIIYI